MITDPEEGLRCHSFGLEARYKFCNHCTLRVILLRLAPLSYLRLIIIAIAAYFWFNEVPDAYTWIGGAVIICAALYIAQPEAVQNR